MQTKHRTTQGDPIGNVTSPMVVGGCIIALRCKEGIIIANDTLLAYGGLLKYPDICRYEKINDNVVITATGQYADFQQVTRKMHQMNRQSEVFDDNAHFSVKDYASYLRRICYQKRNSQNPYYNNFVIAGIENGQPHLATVDLYGNYITNDYVTIGFAKHFGLALIANEWNPQKTAQECKQILKRCFSVIFMRVCQSVDKVQFTLVTKQGISIGQPQKISSNWDFKEFKQRKNEKLWQ